MPQHDASVEDVEWGDEGSGGDDEETESEKSAGGDDVGQTFKPAGHSSIAEADATKKGDKKKASFESWESKGEAGEDFGEESDEEKETKADPEKDGEAKKEDAKEGEKEETAGGDETTKKEDDEKEEAATDKEKEKTLGEDTETFKPGKDKEAEKPEDPPVPAPPEDEAAAEVALVVAEGDSVAATPPPADGEAEAAKGDDLPPGEPAGDLEAADEAEPETTAEEEAEEEEGLSRRQRVWRKVRRKFLKYRDRAENAFSRVRDRHTIKVRCVLIPVFIILTPLLILWTLYKAFRYALYQLFRNQEKEEEEEQRRADEEEAKRIAAAIAAGPQRSKLKPPPMNFKFGRDRTGKKAGDGSPRDGEGKHHKMNLRDAAKAIRPDEKSKRLAEAKEAGLDTLRHHQKDPLWKRLLPSRYPKYFREWWRSRSAYFKRVAAVIDTIEEEEEFDWENLDENGNPAQNKFLVPRRIRRLNRLFILIYFDPFLELLDNLPLFVAGIRWVIRLMPLFVMFGTWAWFGYNLWRNFQYVEGNCVVEKLPSVFETVGKIDEMVRARYIVRRFFAYSPERDAGYVIQECVANVPCSKMDYGATNGYEDDRCVTFQAWKLGDEITCFYMNSDFWGDKGTELSCLDLPSKMERETFTLAIATVINILICVILGTYRWHQNDMKKQVAMAEAEARAAEAEEAEAKRRIEEREQEEALRQQEETNRELGITQEGDDEAMADMATFAAAMDDEADQQAGSDERLQKRR